MHDPTHEYDYNCERCQPALMDMKTGKAMAKDHPVMTAVRKAWMEKTTSFVPNKTLTKTVVGAVERFMRYEIRGLYVIFAHMSEVEGTVGRLYPAGTLIGRVGNHKTNGGWYPHLHLQCMRRYNLSVDGYGPNDEYTKIEFPDPMYL